MLGEELAALQRSEDIAQGDVVRRPRQFETASRTEPSADQSGCRHQREKPANHDRICVRAFRHILRTQDLAWIGGQSRQQMNANGKSGARSHRSLVARRAPILQSRAAPTTSAKLTVPMLLRTGRQPRPPARLRLPDRRLDPNSGRRLTKRRRQSRGWRRGSVSDRRRGRRRRGSVNDRRRGAAPGARGPPGAQDEAREAVRPQAPRARASPQEPDEARTGRERLALEREAQPAEPERAARRPAAELRHWASALGCLLALVAAASEPEQGTLLER